MENPSQEAKKLKLEMANRLFFRLYQCANMLHKTGSRAIEEEGLTTQQWAVLGALSRDEARHGMSIGELARYLMLSRQNLSGVIGRMERDGHLHTAADPNDRRSRLVRMTPSGQQVWLHLALPKIHDYYSQVLEDFSLNDTVHAVHYLLKILHNMQRLDQPEHEDAHGANLGMKSNTEFTP
ncbi:MAG: MarR family transcriptional regulator [Betaproteobacteria bacterium]|jgi:DNA-binding MarR family transcriptional regulator|nr:MarR family transcriptional regulator [Betaproteobacteria bacterium]